VVRNCPEVCLNFVVLAILFMSAYRKLWPGGLNAFKIGAIMWKKVATVQARVIQGVPKLVIQNSFIKIQLMHITCCLNSK
jgi:hypothetical protein